MQNIEFALFFNLLLEGSSDHYNDVLLDQKEDEFFFSAGAEKSHMETNEFGFLFNKNHQRLFRFFFFCNVVKASLGQNRDKIAGK